MEVLIIYDSNFENTQKVADHIAKQFGGNSSSLSVIDFKEQQLQGIKLLIVGSPVNAWRPTKKIIEFLNRLDPTKMKEMKGAAFNTRVKSFISGNAAKKNRQLLIQCERG